MYWLFLPTKFHIENELLLFYEARLIVPYYNINVIYLPRFQLIVASIDYLLLPNIHFHWLKFRIFVSFSLKIVDLSCHLKRSTTRHSDLSSYNRIHGTAIKRTSMILQIIFLYQYGEKVSRLFREIEYIISDANTILLRMKLDYLYRLERKQRPSNQLPSSNLPLHETIIGIPCCI